jgi:hypothetical protein
MAEAAIELARQMKPGPLPAPVKAPMSHQVWGYGKLPPELN